MKKITINDVAKQAGVSKTTVSHFLNGNFSNMSLDTKNKISQVIKELNYRPNRQAQSLKSFQSKLIGVVVADISNLYSSLLLKGIGNVLTQANYQVVIVDSANSEIKEHELLNRLLDQNVDGIVIQPIDQDTRKYDFVADKGVSMVMVDRTTKPLRYSTVITNNYDITQELMEYFDEESFENVLVVTEPLAHVQTRKQRFQAVFDTVKNSENQNLILLEANLDENLIEKLQENLSAFKKNIIFAANGRMMIKVMNALNHIDPKKKNSTVVTGFDDWDLASILGSGVTSIVQPSTIIGEAAAKILLEQIKGSGVLQEVMIPSEIRRIK